MSGVPQPPPGVSIRRNVIGLDAERPLVGKALSPTVVTTGNSQGILSI